MVVSKEFDLAEANGSAGVRKSRKNMEDVIEMEDAVGG
jgi:hypothetical protein